MKNELENTLMILKLVHIIMQDTNLPNQTTFQSFGLAATACVKQKFTEIDENRRSYF